MTCEIKKLPGKEVSMRSTLAWYLFGLLASIAGGTFASGLWWSDRGFWNAWWGPW